MSQVTGGPVELKQANLGKLRKDIAVPTYDRKALVPHIVHMSVGGFHRGHQAVYLDDLLHKGGPRWGICGVGLLPGDSRMRDVLQSQDCLYTVVERSAKGDTARVIGSMIDYLFMPEDPNKVIEKMAAPECRIATLTITEGGYFVNQGTGEFNEADPAIQRDLANPHAPTSSFGLLAEALDRRRQRGLPPFTVQSCDNLQANGDVLKRMFLAFANRRDKALGAWLAEKGAFPNAMVDRIVPATTDEHRAMVREKFALADGWPVVTEPFKQWVVEDRFAQGRPAWEEVGAQLTANVHPYETMKIRLLNASHQGLCYIGMLLGLRFADETMADPDIRRLVETMMNVEVTPLLPPVPGIDLAVYKKTLVERFGNPTLRDQLARIGTEGSARIPKFVLPSILETLPKGGPMRTLCFTVAAWFRYLEGKDDQGKDLPINEPLADELVKRAKAGREDPTSLLALRQLFGDVLPKSAPFVQQVKDDLQALYRQGARAALKRALG